MKATELMIGDWVYVPAIKKPVRVGIAVYRSMIVPNREDDDIHASIGEEYLQPIPITPDILEKNGFKLDKDIEHARQYIYPDNLDVIPPAMIQFSFYGDATDVDTLFQCWIVTPNLGENSSLICDLKYVHELQHALRLCRIEKEIVL